MNIANTVTADELENHMKRWKGELVQIYYFSHSKDDPNYLRKITDLVSEHDDVCYCLVNIDDFTGESEYLGNTSVHPKLSCYYNNTLLGEYNVNSVQNISDIVEYCRKHVSNLVSTLKNPEPPRKPAPNKTQYKTKVGASYKSDKKEIAVNNTSDKIIENGFMLPTLYQMKQMYQMFTMMQKMGILEIPKLEQVQKPIEEKPGEPIILPNGDQLIPLEDGNYGLIKKK
jgi:hypothetical protein